MKFINYLSFHHNYFKQSLDDYQKDLRLELAKRVLNQKIIYLDTKFWILLRDGVLYPSQKPMNHELLELAISLAKTEKCIFPISEDIFIEVLQQTDFKTRKITIELIDQLSQGVTLISFDDRIRLEFLHFLHFFYSNSGKTCYATNQLVWTKIPYLLGFYILDDLPFSPKNSLILQKAWLDKMWNISMMDILKLIEENDGLEAFLNISCHNVDLVKNLNEGKFNHANEANSFKKMLMNEISGLIDVYQKDLAEMIEYIYYQETSNLLSVEERHTFLPKNIQLINNCIYNTFYHNKIGQAMPSFHIKAALHAIVRWNKEQRFETNDLPDFKHAIAALTYCDYFFTEKRLTHLVTQKKLGFDYLYNCQVRWKLKEAICLLQSI